MSVAEITKKGGEIMEDCLKIATLGHWIYKRKWYFSQYHNKWICVKTKEYILNNSPTVSSAINATNLIMDSYIMTMQCGF